MNPNQEGYRSLVAEEQGKEEQRKRNSPATAMERRWRACRAKSNLPAMLRGEEAAAASSTMTPDVGKRRRRRAGGRRRQLPFSVSWSGGEAQGAEDLRKKALWRG
jgi:hypothetical protein